VIIAVASDHAGYQLKDQLRDWLREAGHEVLDLGTNSRDTVDYPRFGSLLAETVAAARRSTALRSAALASDLNRGQRHPACRCALVNEPLSAAPGP
jgi:ribose 5-phosphate isomerase B